MREIHLSAWCSLDNDDHSWIPQLLSSVGSTELVHITIDFHIGTSDRAERLKRLLGSLSMEDKEGRRNPLFEIDECLSSEKFSKVEPGKLVVMLAFSMGVVGHRTLGVTDEQWKKLVRKRLPRADKRGILRSVQFLHSCDALLIFCRQFLTVQLSAKYGEAMHTQCISCTYSHVELTTSLHVLPG